MKKELTEDSLIEAGVHYGYSRTRRHPTITPFIYGNKKGSDIINIEKIIPQIEEAAKFVSELGAAGKVALFVGVKPEARGAVTEVAETLKQPFVTERWIGGTLTNFMEIKRRIQKLVDMREKIANGEFSKYTKKEQLLIQRDIDRLDRDFGGISALTNIPSVVVIIDSRHEAMCVKEAKLLHIPVVALSNTDCTLEGIEYPIVGNDGSVPAVRFVLETIKSALALKVEPEV